MRSRSAAGWSLVFIAACSSGPAPAPQRPMQPAPPAQAAVAPVAPASAPPPPAAPACPRALALDAAAIAAEAACLLGAYVRIDTTNPPGNELPAAQFLREVLAREGIESQIIESAPGRANLIARLRGDGSGGGALALLHHMDVVPADAREWSVPPLAGELRDGQLWGRGALDNKGGGVLALMTVLLAKRLGTPLPRDLVFLAVADEEAGGAFGARFLNEQHPQLFAGVEFVLTEGGAVVQLGEGKVYSVELAQKAPLWLRLTARGRSGHGASPTPDAAALVLVRALARLAAHSFPIVVLPEVQALYAAKAETVPEPLRSGYRDLRAALARPAFRERFMQQPRDAALVHNTLSITMLEGSSKENVISAEASAVLDMRLLPGQDPQAVQREVIRVMAEPAVEVAPILSWQAFSSPRDTALFRAIEARARARDPGAPVLANVIGGFTDCNAFRAKGITCYGFLPLRLHPELFEHIHGKDERIPLDALSAGVIELHALLGELGPKRD